MDRANIRFLRCGQVVEVDAVRPTETLLDYLRLREGATGTKEGCCEGDCGACTVALGTLRNGEVHLEPVNACVLLLGMVDGKEVITVDDLAPASGGLHPVQQALVSAHASQCGFCTPGFVMSLFTLYHSGQNPNRQSINDWLAGNLCRCTGYRPIAAAALDVCGASPADQFSMSEAARAAALATSHDALDVFIGDAQCFFAAPKDLGRLADLYQRNPESTLVAGATDVGLWITKQLRPLHKVIHLGRVSELNQIRDSDEMLELGATVSYAQAQPALGGIDSDIAELLRRIGGKQVRAAGTVGGNIANGSPIGDTPPLLLALGAQVELRLGSERRRMPLEEFFIDYGQQARQPGELLTKIFIPRPQPDEMIRCYKISKRFDQDISALLGAFKFKVVGERLISARVAFGGMAAIPKRALNTEAALAGLSLKTEKTWETALDSLAEDFAPIDDLRATAGYRSSTARALLHKALLECAGAKSSMTRVTGHRPPANG